MMDAFNVKTLIAQIAKDAGKGSTILVGPLVRHGESGDDAVLIRFRDRFKRVVGSAITFEAQRSDTPEAKLRERSIELLRKRVGHRLVVTDTIEEFRAKASDIWPDHPIPPAELKETTPSVGGLPSVSLN